jgi:esterase/lipase
MKKILKVLIVISLVLIIIYVFGPSPSEPKYNNYLPQIPVHNDSLEDFVNQKEAKHKLKPGNNAEIVWFDSLHKKTKYSIVYLHGFSASKEEGNPIHLNIAKKFKCNLYLSRLSQHGIDTTEALLNMTALNLWESAKEAYAIGKCLGDSVILMGTSTGASLALQLAAQFSEVKALVLLSPNIEINDPNAWLLNNPWGLQIARLVKGSNYNFPKDTTAMYSKYWYKQYRIEALIELEEYVETAMTEATFSKIHQPVLCLYYFKDEQHQDPVVRVSATKNMMKMLATPAALKVEKAMSKVENHVLGSYVVSKDVEGVEIEVVDFLSKTIH